jgi:hypothetical protein
MKRNAYTTQSIRDRYGLCWNEEYILGMLFNRGEIKTADVLNTANENRVMSPATTHKYLINLTKRKFVNKKRDKSDSRICYLTPSVNAVHFLEEINNGS